ncbi:PREDICTED: uncharacterized protein LOC108363012 [Rhagoletis zephyria]|uniref:uncharacterized protein LOC108363012 n=1 Tax=Rhagoletis zephyria TaxID=28612 RepID=UPI000811493D|nr:PREDICTED: uncharacterized protein LOC108363012 [Rhagoletis zephyria]XP_036340451.1 uncharacterized protein LOC118749781 [Rhagoletis pomonella]
MPLNDSNLITGGQGLDDMSLDRNPRLALPAMTTENVEAYFYSLDFWFQACGVTADLNKFNIVLANVPPLKLLELQPLIEATPATAKYQYIREKFIEHFNGSVQSRLQRVLKAQELGDRRPSELFYDLKRTAGAALSDAILEGLWISRLPSFMQAAIIATSASTTQKLKIADSISEANETQKQHGFEVSALQNMPNEISNLKTDIAALNKRFDAFLEPTNSDHRKNVRRNSRSASGVASSNSFCWYHTKFGARATRCREPCTFTQSHAATVTE